MNFWEKVKRDLQKGMDESIAFVKEGAAVVMKKAEELTDEGKKRYILYELKSKVQKQIAELGGQVYDLSSKTKNPMLDSKVKDIVARIRRLETEILKLEGKQSPVKKSPVKKAGAKKTAVRKAPARKKAAPKTPGIPTTTTEQ